MLNKTKNKIKNGLKSLISKKNFNHYYKSNEIAWNTVSLFHKKEKHSYWLNKIKEKNFSCLNQQQIIALKKLRVKNKTVCQPACNNGVELISIKKLGASYCLGIDISKEFIDQANELKNSINLKNCDFIKDNFLKTRALSGEKFDLVFISVGTLPWMIDLEGFFKKTSLILKNNGQIIINEMNPLLHMFDYNSSITKIKVNRSYFNENIDQNNISLDYYGKNKYKVPNQYCKYHKLSEIINTLVKTKFSIVSFEEHHEDFSLSFKKLEKSTKKMPLSYTLIAKKQTK
ncbi:MAG: class I SAM-dependent methyltransferase [Candidatus Pacebacteria bacterium]|nr:class I SAM-dependent methyltransferase [Candidatus Paceibacterota bacterium]